MNTEYTCLYIHPHEKKKKKKMVQETQTWATERSSCVIEQIHTGFLIEACKMIYLPDNCPLLGTEACREEKLWELCVCVCGVIIFYNSCDNPQP